MSADSGNLVPQFSSALLIVGIPVPLYQIEELVSKFVVEDEFKSSSDIFSAFGLAYAGMKESQVLYMLHDLLNPVTVLVEWSSHSLEVPGIERTFFEFLFTFEPEAAFSGFYRNQQEQLKFPVKIVSDKFSAVLDFFITHALPRVILPDGYKSSFLGLVSSSTHLFTVSPIVCFIFFTSWDELLSGSFFPLSGRGKKDSRSRR